MRVRRCAVLVFEPRETLSFDLDSLLAGDDGLAAERGLYALAAHLDAEQEVTAQDVALLACVPVQRWTALHELQACHGAAIVERLLHSGLLIAEHGGDATLRERDQRVRDAHWRPLAAASHYFNRWEGVRSGEEARRAGYASFSELVEKLGAPPPLVGECNSTEQPIALPPPQHTAFDALLRRRATCRNFDNATELRNDHFSTMLHRVFGAQAVAEMPCGSAVMKRNSPSGGGLHPTEAYLIVQRVAGVAPGLYHYHPQQHVLEPLPGTAATPALALSSVAAQRHFADAHVLVAMASRFARSFWKYRNHAKAYRVTTLDVGHLSQTLYLSATELGLGAFVTAAVNEIEIEQAFGLDPLQEGVLAVCGFGPRADTQTHSEFDPLGQVWPPA